MALHVAMATLMTHQRFWNKRVFLPFDARGAISDRPIFSTIPASKLSFLTRNRRWVQTGWFLTLVLEPEARFVL